MWLGCSLLFVLATVNSMDQKLVLIRELPVSLLFKLTILKIKRSKSFLCIEPVDDCLLGEGFSTLHYCHYIHKNVKQSALIHSCSFLKFAFTF